MPLDSKTRAVILRTGAAVAGLTWFGFEMRQGSMIWAGVAGFLVMLVIVDFMASSRE